MNAEKSGSETLREKAAKILKAFAEKGAELAKQDHSDRTLSEVLDLLLSEEDFNTNNLALCKRILDEAIPMRSTANVGIKYPSVKIICHGYDYVIPSTKKGSGFIGFLVNLIIPNGQWLKKPMEKNGYEDDMVQRMIVHYMIDLFNGLFEKLLASKVFPHLRYIDLRNTAVDEEDWFDEIHLTSDAYKLAADEYKTVIRAKMLSEVG